MSDEFFILEHPADEGKGYCTVDQLEGFEDTSDVGHGMSLKANPPKKLTMSMYADEPKKTVLPDCVQNMDCLLIVSPRLRAFLEAQKVSNVEYYPLTIKDHKGKVASDKYFVAHLINHVDCIDAEASGATWTGTDELRRIMFLDKLALHPAKVPQDRKLFFPRYFNEVKLLRADLAEAMKKEKFTNVEIVPSSEAAF